MEKNRVKQVSCGNFHTCAIVEDHDPRREITSGVKCWGKNEHGVLGYGDTIERGSEPSQMGDNLRYVDLGKCEPMQITSGPFHNCVLCTNLRIKCWGLGQHG